MYAASDAEDERLLAAGDHARLIAKYLPVVETRGNFSAPGRVIEE